MAKFRVVISENVRTEFIVETDDGDELNEIVADDEFDLNALELDADSTVEEVDVEECDENEVVQARVKNGAIVLV